MIDREARACMVCSGKHYVIFSGNFWKIWIVFLPRVMAEATLIRKKILLSSFCSFYWGTIKIILRWRRTMTNVHVFEILEPLNFLCYDVLESNFLMKIAPSQQQKLRKTFRQKLLHNTPYFHFGAVHKRRHQFFEIFDPLPPSSSFLLNKPIK